METRTRLIHIGGAALNPFLFLSLFFILMTAENASAQISQLFGGSNRLRYRGNLSYEGASALGEMSDISSIYPRTGVLFGNPAGILNTHKLQFQVDVSLPGLGINTSTSKSDVFKDLIKQGLDDFLTGENEVSGDDRVDPEVATDMAQTPGLDGLGVCIMASELFPFIKFPVGVSAGFERLVDFQLELDVNDFTVGVEMPLDESDPASDTIKARFSMQTGMGLFMGLNRRGVGIGFEIPNTGLKFGFAAHQYMAYWDFSAVGEVNGFISRSERESSFNLESSPYTDDLSIDYTGYGRGSAPGFGFGAAWDPIRWFGVDFVSSWNGTIELGSAGGEHYTLNAIDQESGGGSDSAGGEIFDVGKLNLTKMTLTKNVQNDIRQIELQLPSRIGTSVHLNFRRFQLNLDYGWYYRGFFLDYRHISRKTMFDTTFNDVMSASDGSDSMEVSRSEGRIGSYLAHKAAVGLQIWGLFLNGGVYIGDPILFENGRQVPVNILPIFNMGYSMGFRKKYTLDVSLVSLPLTVLKTTVRYHM